MSGLVLFLSAFTGIPVDAQKPVGTEAPLLTVANQPITLESFVREYFADNPMLAEIAKCESRFRHYRGNGVLRGDYDRNDIGVMQINERYHTERAEKNGFDIHTLEGNLGYARWLYEREGLQPWKSSRACWKGAETLAMK